MSLGVNRSSSRQSSSSSSQSSGSSQSMSQDLSQSMSDSMSGGTSSTTQDIAFRELFAQLYGGASGAAGTALARAPELMETARSLFTGGTEFMDTLTNNPAMDYFGERLSGENPHLQEQIDALQEDTGRLFREELNPAIVSEAVAGGSLGGGRHGVAQGLAMESAAREFTRGATALRSADMTARDSAAATALQGSLSAANTGLGSLPMLMDLATNTTAPELGIYSNLASILGGPTVLSQSESEDFSTSTARSLSEAFARAFSSQQSTSKGESSGRSSGWGFSASMMPGG